MTSSDFSVKFHKLDESTKLKLRNSDKLNFEIQGDKIYGLDKSVINGIRRTLITDIDTCAFEESNIIINTNKSALHNEFLKHRISLIPLYIDPIKYDYLLFELKVKCNDETIKNITVDMFDVYRLNTHTKHLLKEQSTMDYIPDEDKIEEKLKVVNTTYYDLDNPLSDTDKEKIFKPFKYELNKQVRKSYFLLTELKSLHSDKEYEEIELYCIPSIGTGRTDAKYNNISTAVYSFKHNENMFKDVLKDKIKINNVKNVEEYSNSLYLSEGDRYYHRDTNNEPYWYNFMIESNHYFDSKTLFIQSVDILENKFTVILENMKQIGNESPYTIEPLKNDTTYKINMPNEDDTTGNILQCHMVNKFINSTSFVQFCGYKRPHPLQNEIFINIMVRPNEYSQPEVVQYIISEMEKTIEDILNVLKRFKDTADKKL